MAIDNNALLENGYYNLNCGSAKVDGLQVKDAQLVNSVNDNIYIPGECFNVRLIDDRVFGAGAEGILFGAEDLTIANSVITQSQGTGIDLNTANYVSVVSSTIDHNGEGLGGGHGIEVNAAWDHRLPALAGEPSRPDESRRYLVRRRWGLANL